MDTCTRRTIERQLSLIMRSMIDRCEVAVMGKDLNGKIGDAKRVVDVVNVVAAEDGSGANYIMEFQYGDKLFVRLDNAFAVMVPETPVVEFRPIKIERVLLEVAPPEGGFDPEDVMYSSLLDLPI